MAEAGGYGIRDGTGRHETSWKQEWKEYLRVCRCHTNPPFFWDGIGKLGRLIQLLYCARLFVKPEERSLYLRLHPTNGVTDKDLRHIASFATGLTPQLLQDDELKSLIPILDRIMDSAYFQYQDPSRCSMSVRCITRLHRKAKGKRNEQVLVSLLKDLLRKYEQRGWILRWWPITRPTNPFPPLLDPCVDDDHALSQLIHAINSCAFTSLLCTSRPGKSVVPHTHALMTCIQHAYLWMANAGLPIYKKLPSLSYAALRSGAESHLLSFAQTTYSKERIPFHREICKRKLLIWYKLYGITISDDPLELEAY